jgi:hypothetical protein
MSSWRTALVLCTSLVGVGLMGLDALRPAIAQSSEEDAADPYEVVPNWPQPHPDRSLSLSRVGGIYAESPDRVYLFTNGYVPTAWLNQKDPQNPTWPRMGPQSLGNCDEFRPPSGEGPSESCDGKGVPVRGSRWEHITSVRAASISGASCGNMRSTDGFCSRGAGRTA